ncbi:MAG: hypothetical protein K6E20_07380 [Acholeplasmatales bacterium]|nr:hypothetical protein [Acholeplasmatales bacterium]
MKDDILLMEYHNKFGELPPLEMCLSYNHPMYQKLMKQALKTGEPITAEQIDEYIEKHNIKYDMDLDH